MREIKFRAWDLQVSHSIGFLKTWRIENVMEDMAEHSEENSVILQQFTGLKDKNGVEIYEGDFVRLYLELPPNDETISHDVGKISWQFGCYEFCGDKHRGTIHSYNPNYLEVIGNMYENPELIK